MMAGPALPSTLVKVKALLCTWAHFIEEDLGEFCEYDYASDIKVQRFVCTGNIDPAMVIDAFLEGYDGVFVGTCEPDTCRFKGEKVYQAGNKQASAKMFTLTDALLVAGIAPGRLYTEWLSPKTPSKFPKVIEEFKTLVATMGPVQKDELTTSRLTVLREVLQSFRTRWLLGKKLELTLAVNAFGEPVEGSRFKSVMDDTIRKEYIRTWLLKVLDGGPATVEEMAKATGFPSDLVLKHLMRLRQRGQVSFCGEKHHAPIYCREASR